MKVHHHADIVPNEVFELLGVPSREVHLTPILGKGEANEVHLLECARGRFIVRLSANEAEMGTYIKEKWCMERATSAGVPCATCLGIGTGRGKSFMVQEALSAVDGVDWKGDRASLWKELGKLAARINSIPVEGFGFEMHEPTIGKFGGSWKDLVDWSLGYLFDDGFFQKVGVLSAAQERIAREQLEMMYSWDYQPQLSHGNMSPKNVMIDESGKVYVIDWGTAGGSPAPLTDVSDVLTWKPGEKYESAFLEGYGIDEQNLQAIRPRLNCLILQRHLDSIRWAAERREDWERLDFVVYCRRELKALSPDPTVL